MPTVHTDDNMRAYYAERAPVYDRVYGYPERQADLLTLRRRVAPLLAGKRVLEVAAGTGYWTEVISQSAASITSTDGNPEPLAQVAQRQLGCPVATQVADAYALRDVPRGFEGAFAGCWFSHVPIQRRAQWRAALHRHLRPGATVVVLDNSRAQCDRLPITRTDEIGNTYQARQTDAGAPFEVLKNFPEEAELLALIEGVGTQAQFQQLQHYWLFSYQIS